MSIKLAVLKSGEDIIADVKEIMSEDNVVGYLLHNPHSVLCEEPVFVEEEDQQGQVQIRLRPWLILSKDDKVPVRPDWLVTIVEPVDMLKEMYEEKVNGKSSEVSFTES